jgi:hypothetical protein
LFRYGTRSIVGVVVGGGGVGSKVGFPELSTRAAVGDMLGSDGALAGITTMIPFMLLWNVQWKGKVPGVGKVSVYVPVKIVPEDTPLHSTVCGKNSSHDHMTLSPATMLIVPRSPTS